jgi:hypothetical protein
VTVELFEEKYKEALKIIEEKEEDNNKKKYINR